MTIKYQALLSTVRPGDLRVLKNIETNAKMTPINVTFCKRFKPSLFADGVSAKITCSCSLGTSGFSAVADSSGFSGKVLSNSSSGTAGSAEPMISYP